MVEGWLLQSGFTFKTSDVLIVRPVHSSSRNLLVSPASMFTFSFTPSDSLLSHRTADTFPHLFLHCSALLTLSTCNPSLSSRPCNFTVPSESLSCILSLASLCSSISSGSPLVVLCSRYKSQSSPNIRVFVESCSNVSETIPDAAPYLHLGLH